MAVALWMAVAGAASDGGGPDGAGQLVETFHIGRLAIHSADHDPLVVDWRAPIAEPFYRATGRDPQGLVLRRHLALEGRRWSASRTSGSVPRATVGADGGGEGGGGRRGGDGAGELIRATCPSAARPPCWPPWIGPVRAG